MNGFYVSITNNLLEPKHVEKMGSAVWLFMYFIDKMTDISEGQGIVNHGVPVTYDMVNERLGISNRTYQRMLLILREAGYINTLQAKYGVYVTVNKAKKQFGKKATKKTKSSPAKNGTAKIELRQKRISAMPNVADSYDKNGTALYIDKQYNNNTLTNNSTNVLLANESPNHKELVSKLYYEVIKKLDLPVKNHNNVKSAIAKMAAHQDGQMILDYLNFMKDHYPKIEWKFKPYMYEALDIHDKRAKVRSSFQSHVKELATKPKGRGFKVS